MVFGERDSHYLANVLRLDAGDLVEAFDGETAHTVSLSPAVGRTVTGTVVESRRQSVVVPKLTTAFGCVRPGPTEELLRHGTEVGVSRFVPILSRRTTRRPGDRKDRWTTVTAAAAAQSGRTALPTVDAPQVLESFIKETKCTDTRILLSTGPDAEPLPALLARMDLTSGRPVILLVGPEGGFDPEEETAIRSAGFYAVSLTETVLRTETAAILASGMIVTWYRGQVRGITHIERSERHSEDAGP